MADQSDWIAALERRVDGLEAAVGELRAIVEARRRCVFLGCARPPNGRCVVLGCTRPPNGWGTLCVEHERELAEKINTVVAHVTRGGNA